MRRSCSFVIEVDGSMNETKMKGRSKNCHGEERGEKRNKEEEEEEEIEI